MGVCRNGAILILLVTLICSVTVTHAQVRVQGTVTGGEGSEPIPGVTVNVRGSGVGTTTDIEGAYVLEVPDVGVVLVFRFVGYRTQEIILGADRTTLDVVMRLNVLGLDEVVVVGSRRQARLVKDSPVPVDVFGPRDLESVGSTDVDEVLRSNIPSYTPQQGGDEASIMRPATLRGLPTDNVIVLINGKRRHRSGSIALSASSLNEGAQGPDLNMIPTIAIKQFEILRDAATAQYGADAVAGVFNIQLRDYTQGVRVRMQGGEYTEGGGRYGYVATNIGLPLTRKGFVSLSMEYRDALPTIRSAQRDDALVLRARGYPVAHPAQIWGSPEVSHSVLGFVNAGVDLGHGAHLYTFGGWGRRTQEGGFFFRSPGTSTARTSVFRFGSERAVVDLQPENDLVCSDPMILPGLDADNAAIQAFVQTYRGECFLFNETFPGGFTPRFGGDVYDVSMTPGLRSARTDGLIWDVSISGARSLLDFFIYRTINASYGPESPTSFDPRDYVQEEIEASISMSYPLKLSALSSPLNVAWGGVWRNETFESRAGDTASWKAGPYAEQGFSVGANGYQGLNPAFAGRWLRPNFGIYVDVEADLTRQWLVNLALRYENFYENFGGTLTGKLAVLFRATDRIFLRATTSTGFRAPTPGQANLNVFRTTGFSKAHGLIEIGILPSTHPIARALGGEPLKKETARSLSLGFVMELSGSGSMTLTADYFDISLSDRIALTGNIPITDEVIRIIDARDVLGGVTNIRQVRFYSNDFSTRTRGLDVLLTWEREISRDNAASGSVAWNFTATDLTSFSQPQQITSFLDEQLSTPLTLSLLTRRRQVEFERVNPRNRLVITGRQVWKDWTMMLRVSYFDSWQACRFGNAACVLDDGSSGLDRFKGVWHVDAETGYRLREDYHLALGTYNLFNANRSAPAEETARQGNLYPRSVPFNSNGTPMICTVNGRPVLGACAPFISFVLLCSTLFLDLIFYVDSYRYL